MPFDATPPEPHVEADTILHILVGARQILARPKGWTRLVCARDVSRKEVSLDSDRAVAFCLIGAIDRERRRFRGILRNDELFALLNFTDYGALTDFNDGSPNKTRVLARLDKGIAKRRLELQVKETADAV